MNLKKKCNSTPGHDHIHYLMIYNLCKKANLLLLDIFNDVWILNVTITEWATQDIIPILKHGKNPNSAESYCPIFLSSCITKTFERMIKNQLEWFVEKMASSHPSNKISEKNTTPQITQLSQSWIFNYPIQTTTTCPLFFRLKRCI